MLAVGEGRVKLVSVAYKRVPGAILQSYATYVKTYWYRVCHGKKKLNTVSPAAGSFGTLGGRALACIPPRGRFSPPPPAGLLLVTRCLNAAQHNVYMVEIESNTH